LLPNLVAGVDYGADEFFGTLDDVGFPGGSSAISARIASITRAGQIRGTIASTTLASPRNSLVHSK
jgi:hypothetical protein